MCAIFVAKDILKLEPSIGIKLVILIFFLNAGCAIINIGGKIY